MMHNDTSYKVLKGLKEIIHLDNNNDKNDNDNNGYNNNDKNDDDNNNDDYNNNINNDDKCDLQKQMI